MHVTLQNQHLEAQVELLEADLAGRHNADSRPGSPRDTVESLQADNARLQHQVHTSLWFALFTLVDVVLTPPVHVDPEMLALCIVLGTPPVHVVFRMTLLQICICKIVAVLNMFQSYVCWNLLGALLCYKQKQRHIV